MGPLESLERLGFRFYVGRNSAGVEAAREALGSKRVRARSPEGEVFHLQEPEQAAALNYFLGSGSAAELKNPELARRLDSLVRKGYQLTSELDLGGLRGVVQSEGVAHAYLDITAGGGAALRIPSPFSPDEDVWQQALCASLPEAFEARLGLVAFYESQLLPRARQGQMAPQELGSALDFLLRGADRDGAEKATRQFLEIFEALGPGPGELGDPEERTVSAIDVYRMTLEVEGATAADMLEVHRRGVAPRVRAGKFDLEHQSWVLKALAMAPTMAVEDRLALLDRCVEALDGVTPPAPASTARDTWSLFNLLAPLEDPDERSGALALYRDRLVPLVNEGLLERGSLPALLKLMLGPHMEQVCGCLEATCRALKGGNPDLWERSQEIKRDLDFQAGLLEEYPEIGKEAIESVYLPLRRKGTGSEQALMATFVAVDGVGRGVSLEQSARAALALRRAGTGQPDYDGVGHDFQSLADQRLPDETFEDTAARYVRLLGYLSPLGLADQTTEVFCRLQAGLRAGSFPSLSEDEVVNRYVQGLLRGNSTEEAWGMVDGSRPAVGGIVVDEEEQTVRIGSVKLRRRHRP